MYKILILSRASNPNNRAIALKNNCFMIFSNAFQAVIPECFYRASMKADILKRMDPRMREDDELVTVERQLLCPVGDN